VPGGADATLNRAPAEGALEVQVHLRFGQARQTRFQVRIVQPAAPYVGLAHAALLAWSFHTKAQTVCHALREVAQGCLCDPHRQAPNITPPFQITDGQIWPRRDAKKYVQNILFPAGDPGRVGYGIKGFFAYPPQGDIPAIRPANRNDCLHTTY